MIDYEAMGRRIRRKRQERGLTQSAFAHKIALSTSFFGHIERGSRVPSLDTLVIIANELNVGLDVLLRDSLKVQPPNDRYPERFPQDIRILRSYLSDQLNYLKHWSDAAGDGSDENNTNNVK